MARRSTITKRVWGRNYSEDTSLSAGALLAVDLSSTIVADEVTEATVQRCIGRILAIDQTSNTAQFAVFGIIVDDESQTAFQDPETQDDADWMHRDSIIALTQSTVRGSDMVRWDIRSQRRMRERDDTLWLVIKNSSSGTFEINYMVNTLWGTR